MKTLKVKFNVGYADKAAALFYNLDLKILLSWSEEGFMDATYIFAVLKLNSDSATIKPDLQIEKLREHTYIKFLS